jgi:Septum formation
VRRLAVAATLAALLPGCGTTDPPRRDPSGAVVDAGELEVNRARVGDCFAGTEGSEPTATLSVVPCTVPHDREVFDRFDLEGDHYPGEEAVIQAAARACLDAFAGYVGLPYLDQSALTAFPIVPSRRTWEDRGDRTVLCVLAGAGAALVGSQRDAARSGGATVSVAWRGDLDAGL